MKVASVLAELESLGYLPQVQGDKLNLIFRGGTRPPLSQVQPLVAVLKRHKPEVLAYLKGQAPDVPSCNTCPWCLDNPWSHYPDLPKWCGYWWDHLLADNPQCRDRREGRIPDPRPGEPRARRPSDPLRRPTTGDLESNKGSFFTCFECAHFDPADSSPNPAQAWGRCRQLGKGRYGVARVCDAFSARGAKAEGGHSQR
ncbi:MAG: hypothetical protein JRI66_11930 [Deltaproteobacteria bacterium]|nr:hypothetical protein [Deltaproteobacteria bacterium]